MQGPEQLALELGLPAPGRRRPTADRHLWLRLGRVVAALLGALLLAGAFLTLLPYRSTIASVPIEVTASVTPSDRGLTVDSNAGDLQFRHVTSLPLGLHVSPTIDLRVVRAASKGGAAFSEQARADLVERVPGLVAHFAVAALVGLLVGALAGDLLFDGAVLLAFGRPVPGFADRVRRLHHTSVRVGAVTLGVAVLTAGVAAVTYRASWSTRYAVTGLLADVVATPGQLAALDARDSGAADKLRAVLRLQDALTQPPSSTTTPDAAYRVLFISDVHRRNIYPYLQKYIDANDVRLIVNTGDETLVGSTGELTGDYLASIRSVTSRTPMIWVKGNHDSSSVARMMDAIPGVTVLDGQVVTADGLQVYGTADPRTYAAPGDAGSDDPETVTRLETGAAALALDGIDRGAYLDLLLAHEPVEADVLGKTLGSSVRAQASGHVHHQNAESDLQRRGRSAIRLVEGTTGLGGLLADAGDPMEFSILSVTADCQFSRIVRYALSDPALPAGDPAVSFGKSSSFVVHFFTPQAIAPDRTCSPSTGVAEPVSATSPTLHSVTEWGTATASPSPVPLVSPKTVDPADEAGDEAVPGTTPRRSATPTP